MDGMSLLPALRGQPQTGHEELYFSHARGKALRCGEWKLVRQDKQAWELYNIKSDPNELHNLADRLPEKLAELQAKWNDWQKHQSERSKDRGNETSAFRGLSLRESAFLSRSERRLHAEYPLHVAAQ